MRAKDGRTLKTVCLVGVVRLKSKWLQYTDNEPTRLDVDRVYGSKTFLCSSCHTASEYRTTDRSVDSIEGIHDALDPGLVDIGHELPHSFLGLSTGRIIGK